MVGDSSHLSADLHQNRGLNLTRTKWASTNPGNMQAGERIDDRDAGLGIYKHVPLPPLFAVIDIDLDLGKESLQLNSATPDSILQMWQLDILNESLFYQQVGSRHVQRDSHTIVAAVNQHYTIYKTCALGWIPCSQNAQATRVDIVIVRHTDAGGVLSKSELNARMQVVRGAGADWPHHSRRGALGADHDGVLFFHCYETMRGSRLLDEAHSYQQVVLDVYKLSTCWGINSVDNNESSLGPTKIATMPLWGTHDIHWDRDGTHKLNANCL
ncbi:hypothetical protein BDZ91DRAFT_225977 [Kalaharituber pfeilii]|nr:hypothetical protein BDZ91DRAFT_225977 [Kalaharituber pfeilii]